MAERERKKRTLYSVWRNRDDRLMILDGTAEQCAEILGIRKNSFYRIVYGKGKNEGYGSAYTVRKTSVEQIRRDERS